MKINIKKSGFIALVSALSLTTFSCLEDQGYADLVNGVGNDKILLSWYGEKGTTELQGVLIPAGSPVYDFKAGISATSSRKINRAMVVEVAVDNAVLVATNASLPESRKFLPLPDDAYDLLSSLTIPADTTEGTYIVKLYEEKIDKSKSYMLPLTIQGQEGTIVPSNLGTLKLTFIGNPLAGTYTHEYQRWNKGDNAGAPDITGTLSAPFAPVDATTVLAQSGYGAGLVSNLRYRISFVNNNGVLTNFSVKIDPDDAAVYEKDRGIKVTDDAKILEADPVTKKFRFTFKVFNGTASRTFIDEYHL